jgi:AcrR family transcriptional regulator
MAELTLGLETHQRVLDAAERLFSKHGYAGVRLRDIASEAGIKHASLYYYAPQGKEQLFVAVMRRSFDRHRSGIRDAAVQAGEDLRAQLHAVARWMASQAPMDMRRVVHSDFAEIAPAHADSLTQLLLDSLRRPIVELLDRARQRGVIAIPDLEMAAMALIGLMQSVHSVPKRHAPDERARSVLAERAADLLLEGLLRR